MMSEPGIRRAHPEEPPAGEELDAFVAEMKNEVLARIARRPRGRFGLGRGGTIAVIVMLLGVGTAAGTAVATGVLNTGEPSSGPATIPLTAPDFPANALRVTFTTLSAGSFTLTVPGVPGAEMTMKYQEGSGAGLTTQTAEFPLVDAAVPRELVITATPGGKYAVDANYVNHAPADYPTNGRGQTFGTPGAEATNLPDLLFAVGDDNGQPVYGYVARTTLTATPSDLRGAAVLDWLIAFRARYPTGQPFPLYGSDGTTILGTFHLYL